MMDATSKKCVVIIRKDQSHKEGYILARDKGYKPFETWIVRSNKDADIFKKTYPKTEIIEAP